MALLLLLSLALVMCRCYWTIFLNGPPPPLLVAAIFFLAYSRLPLWPLEAVWGYLWLTLKPHPPSRAIELAAAMRWAYFDRLIILPLPGEATALRRLFRLDETLAINEAIATARYSNHILMAVAALRSFAEANPLKVRAHLNQIRGSSSADDARDRLLRFTAHNLPEAPARLWQISDRLAALSRSLQEAQSPQAETPTPARLGSAARLLTPDSAPKRDPAAPLSEVGPTLAEIAQELDGIAHWQPDLRHVQSHRDLYGGLAQALQFNTATEIGGYQAPALPTGDAAVYPASLRDTLPKLNQAAHLLRGYTEATSPVTKAQRLLQAQAALEQIAQQLDDIPAPAGPLLALVVDHWRQLTAQSGGELARGQVAGPVPQPYVIANPVVGPGFVGRADIMRRLESLWAGPGQRPSVVLYGHRRMGKSSILQNLQDAQFGPRTLIVDFNLQSYGLVPNTGELLHNLALALYDKIEEALAAKPFSETDVTNDFRQRDPHSAFNRFLRRLDKARQQRRFIVTLDEFEIIEQRIQTGKFNPDLLDYLRGVITDHPWLTLAFAGLHTLQEMTADYWNPLFGSVETIPVSFLSEQAARRLLTAPTPDFAVDYDEEALTEIYRLTLGQPYLTQLIGHSLITRLNRQIFEEQIERDARFTLSDVEAVIAHRDFYHTGNLYFKGVWGQAEADPPGQQAVLIALAAGPASAARLASQSGLSPEAALAALKTLRQHDVVYVSAGTLTDANDELLYDAGKSPAGDNRLSEAEISVDDEWRFTVVLMCRWVRQQSSSL